MLLCGGTLRSTNHADGWRCHHDRRCCNFRCLHYNCAAHHWTHHNWHWKRHEFKHSTSLPDRMRTGELSRGALDTARNCHDIGSGNSLLVSAGGRIGTMDSSDTLAGWITARTFQKLLSNGDSHSLSRLFSPFFSFSRSLAYRKHLVGSLRMTDTKRRAK